MAKILFLNNGPSKESDGLCLVMEIGGHPCTSAHSLHEALGLLRSNPFDLVVTFLELNGVVLGGVVKILRSESPGIPVIILSHKGEIETEAVEVVALPFTPRRLLGAIDRALQNSPRVLQDLPSRVHR